MEQKDTLFNNISQSFEEFLEEIFSNNYSGTDDDMPERFDTWISNLDIQDVIDYAALYGKQCYVDGKKEIIKVTSK